jgi:hypothetical protein
MGSVTANTSVCFWHPGTNPAGAGENCLLLSSLTGDGRVADLVSRDNILSGCLRSVVAGKRRVPTETTALLGEILYRHKHTIWLCLFSL